MTNSRASLTEVGRLYRQSEEISSKIFSDYNNQSDIYSSGLQLMGYSSPLILTSYEDAKLKSNEIRGKLVEACSDLDPIFFVPALIDSCSAFYSANSKPDQSILGVAMKLSLTIIWKNTYMSKSALTRSYQALQRVINLSILSATIENIFWLWEFQDLGTITINEGSITGNSAFL
ncbi:hypothetical protein SAMN05660909_05575 [Chitinophaga terrae (ex Kim and Jung 2007)]|uniref:Uncharacterized protein n=1 Tax=Chitinophaga terrae (ex Kim and Jung 2007) TaxID=408074 RepID=A0A1H4GQS6_9BACT|nr:hypothetical protein [Chitinophaga terrae (ex Kim and Jung 2007)]SEB11370.1 hypothetical protein SAMN05660909_05575 [Chitinophaga terrae (ex Kim and Jung 2007)]